MCVRAREREREREESESESEKRMGDEVAALRAQLAERDAKILEVKEKAKQFVRERMEASAAAIKELQAKLADAESARGEAAGPGELEGLVSQLRAEVAERDAKVNEVKEKAKVFVRDKLKSVQEAVQDMEVRHEQFVGALAAVVPHRTRRRRAHPCRRRTQTGSRPPLRRKSGRFSAQPARCSPPPVPRTHPRATPSGRAWPRRSPVLRQRLHQPEQRCASLALSPLPLILSYKYEKSLCGAGGEC